MTTVLLLCGSLQRASANRAALEAVQTALAARGVEAISFEGLGSVPPLNPDHGDDPGEAVQRLRAQIAASDAVLIAAPEYAGALAGVVKNALDWIVGSGELYGKPIGLVSAGTTGGVLARRDLVRTLCWQGAHVVASLGIESPQTKSVSDAGGHRRFTDPATLRDIEELVSSLVTLAGERPAGRLGAITRLAIDAGVDPGPMADRIHDAE